MVERGGKGIVEAVGEGRNCVQSVVVVSGSAAGLFETPKGRSKWTWKERIKQLTREPSE